MKACDADGVALPSVGELSLRRVDAVDRLGGASRYDEFGEGAVSAANIDPALPGGRLKPIKEDLASHAAPSCHHPLVGGSVVEANGQIFHDQCFPSCRRACGAVEQCAQISDLPSRTTQTASLSSIWRKEMPAVHPRRAGTPHTSQSARTSLR